MTVNVSLCGSVPRSQMTRRYIYPKNILEIDTSLPFQSNATGCRADYTSSPHTASLTKLPRRVSNDCMATLPSQISPPKWAVPARGDAEFEPVDGALHGLCPIDLTSKSCFRFGRSQSSDIQLLHETSSRRHAMIFHHPNGSCYVIDCGSAHGTYVNGMKVNTPVINTDPTQGNTRNGSVIPHRVKKGSLIRFGGIGAPTYALKSFSVHLSDLVNNLERSKSFSGTTNVIEDESTRLSTCSCGRHDQNEGIVNDSLVALNTRLNAMGRISMKNAVRRYIPALARARLSPKTHLDGFTLPALKKRPFTSLIPRTVSTEDHIPKKRALSLESDDDVCPTFGNILDVALVSPSRTKPRFTIGLNTGDHPIVSPNPSIENDNLEMDAVKPTLMVPMSLSLTCKQKKKVKFNVPTPDNFHANNMNQP